jgi:hypothetical protein
MIADPFADCRGIHLIQLAAFRACSATVSPMPQRIEGGLRQPRVCRGLISSAGSSHRKHRPSPGVIHRTWPLDKLGRASVEICKLALTTGLSNINR